MIYTMRAIWIQALASTMSVYFIARPRSCPMPDGNSQWSHFHGLNSKQCDS